MDIKVQIATWNANGLKHKMGQVISFLKEHSIDILLISETKLRTSDRVNVRGYHFVRNDRPGETCAGGVAALINRKLQHHVRIKPNFTLEHLIIKLEGNMTVVAAYNPPNCTISGDELSKLLREDQKVVVAGDFNARHTNWNCHVNNKNGNILNTYINTHNVILIYPDQHTHFPSNHGTPTTIDLIINKNTNISEPYTLPELESDHNPVLFEITHAHTPIHKTITSYKHTDWKAFRRTLDTNIIITPQISTPTELDTQVTLYTRALTHAKHKHTQQVTIDYTRDNLPNEIIDLIKLKNRLRKQWQRQPDPDTKTLINTYNKTIRTLIYTHRNTIWQTKLAGVKTSDNTLWQLAKRFKCKRAGIPTLNEGNQLAETDDKKADLLARTFAAVHDLPDNDEVQSDIEESVFEYLSQTAAPDQQYFRYNMTTPAEVAKILRALPENKAPGPDALENKILKNLSRKAVVQLSYIINATIKIGYFPKQWKLATIVPVRKPNKDPTIPLNYRPISLLCGIAKVAEKIILERINRLDQHLSITPPEQFGFRPQHNTTQQLARITSDVIHHFNKKNVTVMLFLDMEKAFDRVWIAGLLHKLIQLRFPRTLIALLNSYLTHRSFRVRVNTMHSTLHNIRAGVPQGSVLGPRLFTLYTHDMPKFMQTKLAMFADDTAIYAHSFSAVVANAQLQLHSKMLLNYAEKWKIKINASKTEQIVFCRKQTNNRIFQPLRMDGVAIHHQPLAKYLGVQLDSRLNYQQHIKSALAKAHGMLKTIYPLLCKRSVLSVKNKLLLYKTMLRPILMYAAPIWCHISFTAFKPLQTFQNKCLRLILNQNTYARICDLHNTTNTPYLHDYVTHISTNFYIKQLHHNPLLDNITQYQNNTRPHIHPIQTLTL